MIEGFNDAAVQSLIDTFNARIVYAENETHYVGSLTTRVMIGDNEYLTLPTIRLEFAERKDQLERARATMFASYLLHQSREDAISLWKKAAMFEGAQFMAWVRLDVKSKQSAVSA